MQAKKNLDANFLKQRIAQLQKDKEAFLKPLEVILMKSPPPKIVIKGGDNIEWAEYRYDPLIQAAIDDVIKKWEAYVEANYSDLIFDRGVDLKNNLNYNQ